MPATASPIAIGHLAERLNDALPQTQCTRCGYQGCLPYAQAIAEGSAEINQCPPGGQATIQRLAALLEAGRAQSRATGRVVFWRTTAQGFEFVGVDAGSLPATWLGTDTAVQGTTSLQLGPDPLIEPQGIVLVSASQPERLLRVATDGLRPFTVQPGTPP